MTKSTGQRKWVPKKRVPPDERFWRLVEKGEACWLWRGFTDRLGYGHFRVGANAVMIAHRFAYELSKGTIPAGMEIDHLCRVRACVNPDHLEAVTHKVNTHRGQSPAIMKHHLLRERGTCDAGHSVAEFFNDKTGRCRRCAVEAARKRQTENHDAYIKYQREYHRKRSERLRAERDK